MHSRAMSLLQRRTISISYGGYRLFWVLVFVLLFAFSSYMMAQGSGHPPSPRTAGHSFADPLDVVVPVAPTAFKADGKTHLVYELHITNMGVEDCTLTGVEVISADSAARSLAFFSGSDLERMISRLGLATAEKLKVAPDTVAVVYLWVTIDRAEDVPAAIQHRLIVKRGNSSEDLRVETTPIAVGKHPVVIDPPLRGDRWVATNGPSNTSRHRRGLESIGGRAAIAERYATDWMRLGDDGTPFHGDPHENNSYFAEGAEAFAVADGIITAVKDGIPENTPGGMNPGSMSLAVPITLETVGGNHVIINIGDGSYALYAHLKTGSVRVKLGEKVRQGQIIGLVGNTGASGGPHLHFHITDGNSPLGSEGLPYVIPSFEVMGSIGEGWKPSYMKNGSDKRRMEIPLENQIVRFP